MTSSPLALRFGFGDWGGIEQGESKIHGCFCRDLNLKESPSKSVLRSPHRARNHPTLSGLSRTLQCEENPQVGPRITKTDSRGFRPTLFWNARYKTNANTPCRVTAESYSEENANELKSTMPVEGICLQHLVPARQD